MACYNNSISFKLFKLVYIKDKKHFVFRKLLDNIDINLIRSVGNPAGCLKIYLKRARIVDDRKISISVRSALRLISTEFVACY